MVAVACTSENVGSSATVDSGGAVASSGGSEGKLSANNATEEELKAAFEAAGIPNATEWAHEVEDYHLYPVDDTDFAKLRGDLAKYNPGPGVVDGIIALLELP